MKYGIFIHTNNKQGLGAVVSKFSLEKHLSDKSVPVQYTNVDNLEAFKNFAGAKYLRSGKEVIYDPRDLQSFTLSRFMPPQLMGFEGRAIVVDPDIFALKDPMPLLTMDMKGKAIAACRKKDAWDTSMMVMDCSKLQHWKIENILSQLRNKTLDYHELMTLKKEPQDSIMEVPRIYNNLDTLTPETVLIHTTNRLTQPWKTGLKIDFTRNPLPKIAGIIPREWIHFILGKYPLTYQKHPDRNIENMFINLVKDAVKSGAVTKEEIQKEIDNKHVRPDLLKLIA